MKRKRILALYLAAVSCLSLAVSASAAGTTIRKATDFKDYDRTAWYAEAVSAAVDNGLLYIGDSLWQKTYSGDTFPYKQRKNKGEKEQYDKYKKQQDLRLSPVEQSFLDSVEQLERLEDQAH